MNLLDAETLLETRLRGPLPGVDAQTALAPRPRVGWDPGCVPDDARPGAVLVLVYPRDERPHVVLTLRDPRLPKHAGQVSLPGGAAEPGEGLTAAALRETREEIGVDPERVRLLGSLSRLHVPVSGFALHPFVGVCRETPRLVPEPGEVARILEVGVDELMDPRTVSVEERARGDQVYQVPILHVAGEKVWGATAMILAEFLVLLGHRPRPFGDGVDQGLP